MADREQPPRGRRGAGREDFLRVAALSVACMLLASAAVCWVAANWQQLTPLYKLAGAQAVLAALALAAWLRLRKPERGVNHNFRASSHLAGLAGVAAGALLALVGQVYQTGADAWQLFLCWAVLLLPWLAAARTVFLGLLFATVLNTGLALYLDLFGASLFGPGARLWTAGALSMAVADGVLLALWERFAGRLADRWRVGPRVLAAAVAGWLIVAALAAVDGPIEPAVAAMPGLLAAAAAYLVYTRWRYDLAIVSLAALAAFILLAIPLVYLIGSEAGLLAVVLVLLAAMIVTLRRLSALARERRAAAPGNADAWHVSLFRLVAMGMVAIMLIALLFLTLDLDLERIWRLGLALVAAGLLVFRAGKGAVSRELGGTLMAAGLPMFGAGLYEAYGGVTGNMAGIAVVGALMYALADNAALRFMCASFCLGLVALMSWPGDVWRYALDDGGQLAFAWFAYLRVWWFGAGAVLALAAGARGAKGVFWQPLGWALACLAQLAAWLAPAAPSFHFMWQAAPAVALAWLACAALPVAALAAMLWRAPALPFALRVGAPLALAVASIGWMGAPGVSMAVLWLVLGHALARRGLLAFGVLALVAYLARFYYQLDSTLLQKSLMLGATGAWLLVAAWALGAWARRGVSGASAAAPDGAPGPMAEPGAVLLDAGRAAEGPRGRLWRQVWLLAGLAAVLVVVNTGIHQRERILSEGRRVVLALAPVDPRSLMQGDYMALRFEVADEIGPAIRQAPKPTALAIERRRGGLLVLRRDGNGVDRLEAVVEPDRARDKDSAVSQDATVLRFRLRNGHARIVTDAWFFPEGQAQRYEHARYGVFRVDRHGAGLLTGLLDERLRPLP